MRRTGEMKLYDVAVRFGLNACGMLVIMVTFIVRRNVNPI
jgi:hypothetical protein